MARRNLLAEAQVQAQAQVAPQLAALGEALRQARTDRNAAIHTAAAASKGIGRAINRSQGTIKRAYKDTAGLGAPGQSYSSGAYAGAAANERAVTGTVLASSLANALKEGSDRRIEAAAGRAYRVAATESAYRSQVGSIQSKRQSLASQQGLLAASNLSKLTEAQAGRDFTAGQNALQRDFQASQSAADHAFTHHEDALGRRSDRINTGINAKADAGKVAAQQKFTAGENRKDRQLRVKLATGGSAAKPTDRSYKGRNDISTLVQQYRSSGNYSDVASKARKAGFNESVIRAASNLASKGYVAGREVSELAALGIDVPKEWTGVTVRPHTRKRRGK